MTEEKEVVTEKPEDDENVRLVISKTKLILICAVIAIVVIALAVAVWWTGMQSLGQTTTLKEATETMTNVSSDIGRISSILEEIAEGLG